ncbi:WhiB family transcriptional regulator [Streptomyces sp. NPDC048389]|uniref:WhiB family transcriptional regulator n=1 Tax=Streptomyces sp. NPDC048389 TaxID=3154622 RepID=UPI0034522B83
MNVLPLDTATELAVRVAMVRDSVPMDELAAAVDEMGECRRFDSERWLMDTVGTRSFARDLVRTEQERSICQACSVRDRCLSLAILTGDTRDSIHGGLLPLQQRYVARAAPFVDSSPAPTPLPRRLEKHLEAASTCKAA